jgi:pimeloyl-ACP methyl ester carboxylesterase
LYVRRYAKPESDPKTHVILLAGGPGYDGFIEEGDAIRLVNGFDGQIAAYTVDHRGVGGSGKFPIEIDILSNTFKTLPNTSSDSPFDIRDLTMTNAALDVAMLGLAIKAKDPEARLVLDGFSYGSRWALNATWLMPNLFDSAFLGSLPPISGTKHKNSLTGLAEMCAKDEFCRRKMGGDVYKAMNEAIRTLGVKTSNACTEMFHNQLAKKLTGTVGNRTREISSIFFNFLDNSSKQRSPQLLLPFLMATEKCVNKKDYLEKVLQPMLGLISPTFLKNSRGVGVARKNFMIDYVVNSVISFDIEYRDFLNGRPVLSMPTNHTDLHPDMYYSYHYHQQWQSLQKLLKGRKCSQEKPVATPRTAIYMMASRMDLNTTYMPAWSAFNLITAPTKKWLLFDNRSHDGYWGECCDMLEWEAITGKSTGFDYEECVHRTDKNYKLNWRLADPYTAMWDCVPNSNDLDVVSSIVPVFLEIGEMGERGLPDKAFQILVTTHRARLTSSSNESLIMILPMLTILGILISVLKSFL